MSTSTVEVQIRDAIAELRIASRSDRVLSDIEHAMASLAGDSAVHAVILTAADDGFSTVTGTSPDPTTTIERMPQPVIACIEGDASGAGLALALACDIRIASDKTTFACREVAAGAMPAMGVTQRLPRLVGRGRAAAMILLSEQVDANAAFESGLANEVVADGGTLGRARVIAARIAAQGPLAVRYAKEAIRQGLDMPLEQALRYETDLTIILQTTDDREEGVRAFVEKRPPMFQGS